MVSFANEICLLRLMCLEPRGFSLAKSFVAEKLKSITCSREIDKKCY